MKNSIKYTLGLPILILLTIGIVCCGGIINLIELGSEFIGFLIEGDFDFDLTEWWIDVKEIWQPIQ